MDIIYKILTLCIVSSIPLLSQGSIKTSFADHLFLKKEYYRAITEYEHCLFSETVTEADSVYCHLQIIKSYFQGQDYTSILSYGDTLLRSTKNSNLLDSILFYMGMSYLHLNYPTSARIIFRSKPSIPRFQLYSAISSLYSFDWDNSRNTFAPLFSSADPVVAGTSKTIYERLQHADEISHRSPFLAGALSAMVPGAGYAYTGNYQTGLSTFIINSLLLGSSIELLRKDIKFTGSLVTVFAFGWWVGNIYGGVTSAYKYNENKNTEAVKVFLEGVF